MAITGATEHLTHTARSDYEARELEALAARSFDSLDACEAALRLVYEPAFYVHRGGHHVALCRHSGVRLVLFSEGQAATAATLKAEQQKAAKQRALRYHRTKTTKYATRLLTYVGEPEHANYAVSLARAAAYHGLLALQLAEELGVKARW